MKHKWLAYLTTGLALLLMLGGTGLLTGNGLQAQNNDARCFNETNLCISGPIRQYWEANGGLPVFGFPIRAEQTESVEGQLLRVQWFERDRLEIQQAGFVTAGRLGARFLELQGRPWETFERVSGAPPQCEFFAQTGHSLCEPFLSYWSQNGGLERFGFPITEPVVETVETWTGQVQYFERRRMEWHTELPGQPILLGLLGRDVLQLQGQPTPTPTATATPMVVVATPTPTPTAARPSPPVNIPDRITVNDTAPPRCDDRSASGSDAEVDIAGANFKEIPQEFPICIYGDSNEEVDLTVTDPDGDTVLDRTVRLGSDGQGETRYATLPGDDYGDYEATVNSGEDTETFTVDPADNPQILVLPRRDDLGDPFDIYLGGFADNSDYDLYLYIRCSDDPSRNGGSSGEACYRSEIVPIDTDSRGEAETTIRFGTNLPDGVFFVIAADDNGVQAVSGRFRMDD